MNEQEGNEIAQKVEHLFESQGAEDEGMWKITSQFATQLDELQILGLTKLTYIANVCSDKVQKQLLNFRDYYIKLSQNRDTAMYMLRMAEMYSLKHYFTGIQGQIIKKDN